MAETELQFVERIERRWMIAAPEADITRLFTLARRGAAVPPAFVDTCTWPHCGHTAKGQCRHNPHFMPLPPPPEKDTQS